MAKDEKQLLNQKDANRVVVDWNLFGWYLWQKLKEEFVSVIPITLYLGVFQIGVLGINIVGFGMVALGMVLVIFGLLLFIEGLKWGLMPVGRQMGTKLPLKLSLALVLVVAFVLGVGVTFAEPAIGALQTIGAILKPEETPYLYALLNVTTWSTLLVSVIGVGVGVASVLGTLRFLTGWRMKRMIVMCLTPPIVMSLVMMSDKYLNQITALAWDCGAVTTGPVTVPMVLALGIGVATSSGPSIQHDSLRSVESMGGAGEEKSLSGFGIVSLASLFPVLAVQILGLVLYATVDIQDIIDNAPPVPPPDEVNRTPPGETVLLAVRAIVPLIVFAVLVTKLIRESLPIVRLYMVMLEDGVIEGKPLKQDETLNYSIAFQSFSYARAAPSCACACDSKLRNRVQPTFPTSSFDHDVSYGNSIGGGNLPPRQDQFKSYQDDEDEATEGQIPEGIDLDPQDKDKDEENEAAGRRIRTLRPWIDRVNVNYFGLFLCLAGLIVFNFGLTYGLSELGEQAGNALPTAFDEVEGRPTSPRFPREAGITVVILFAFFLGMCATIAEPALAVLGSATEVLTNGRIKKCTLIFAVCIGVASGIAAGVVKIIFNVELVYMLLPAYTIAVVFTMLSNEDFICIAWDSAGVTTGPVTVPLVLALGVSLGNSMDTNGFGILSLASVGPIISVLTLGLIKGANKID